jgi:amidase
MCLDRIDRLDPALNAFTVLRREEALGEADDVQRALDCGDRRPLLGIPFAVKDEQPVAGLVTSYGTGASGVVAPRDSEVVRILREAGAIPVGKTAMPELGMHPFTESVTWGATRNPWDLERTPGGSSGGSAAAVAAGLVPFATAGDGGGSIRIPASCCSLFGLKVQRARLVGDADVAVAGGLSVTGVLARRVADTALLYDVLAGDAWEKSLLDAARLGPTSLKIGLAFSLGTPVRVDSEVRGLVEHVAGALASLGHVVSPIRIKPGNWVPPFSVIGLRTLADAGAAVPARERLEARTRSGLRLASCVPPQVLRWALRRQAELTARLSFEGVDLLLTPTMALPPVRVGRWTGTGLLRTGFGVARFCPFTSLWNFLGYPAASVPAGFTAAGLPVGAQLLARADDEPTLISLAAQLEAVLRWPERRPFAMSC